MDFSATSAFDLLKTSWVALAVTAVVGAALYGLIAGNYDFRHSRRRFLTAATLGTVIALGGTTTFNLVFPPQKPADVLIEEQVAEMYGVHLDADGIVAQILVEHGLDPWDYDAEVTRQLQQGATDSNYVPWAYGGNSIHITELVNVDWDTVHLYGPVRDMGAIWPDRTEYFLQYSLVTQEWTLMEAVPEDGQEWSPRMSLVEATRLIQP